MFRKADYANQIWQAIVFTESDIEGTLHYGKQNSSEIGELGM